MTIEISIETREILRRVSERLSRTCDEAKGMFLVLYEKVLNCRAKLEA